jgi:hypothetical protein
MPLKIRHVKEGEAPKPPSRYKPSRDLVAVKGEMLKLSKGMVLEIETGSEKAVRGTKTLVTRAAKDLGTRWRHWHVGTKVFAKPAQVANRVVGRRRKTT